MKVFRLFFLFISISAYSQTIPNADFENWVTVQSFENPVSWATSNTQVTLATIVTVTKQSSTPQHGTYCAKLESKKPFGFNTVAPGLLTLGTFNLDIMQQTGTVSGGIPWTTRPEKFKGYYKYSPQGGDKCFIGCVLFKYNSTTQQLDTVGVSGLVSPDTQTSWTQFDLPFNYYSQDLPDTMNIIIMSSDGRGTPVNGSILYIDNLSFEFAATSVTTANSNNTFSIYPNPVEDEMTIILKEDIDTYLIEITDLSGRVVYSAETSGQQHTIKVNTTHFNSGMYLWSVLKGGGLYGKTLVSINK